MEVFREFIRLKVQELKETVLFGGVVIVVMSWIGSLGVVITYLIGNPDEFSYTLFKTCCWYFGVLTSILILYWLGRNWKQAKRNVQARY